MNTSRRARTPPQHWRGDLLIAGAGASLALVGAVLGSLLAGAIDAVIAGARHTPNQVVLASSALSATVLATLWTAQRLLGRVPRASIGSARELVVLLTTGAVVAAPMIAVVGAGPRWTSVAA